jgi:hypothetical protein
MDTLDYSSFESHGQSGSSSAVPVTDASNWIAIALIKLGGHQRGGLLGINVGSGGAIGALKITRAAVPGGVHVDWITSFDSPNAADAIAVTPASGLATLSANSTGQVKFHSLAGVQELQVWAKKASTDTTVSVDASVVA